MTIPYFAENQNIVFVPALLALLAVTVVICLPIIFAPTLRGSSRRIPVIVLAAVLVAAGLAGSAVLAGTGFRTLGDERARVQAWIAKTYDLRLNSGQVGELVDGGKPTVALPAIADELGLMNPEKVRTLELKPTDATGDTYTLYFAGKPWPPR